MSPLLLEQSRREISDYLQSDISHQEPYRRAFYGLVESVLGAQSPDMRLQCYTTSLNLRGVGGNTPITRGVEVPVSPITGHSFDLAHAAPSHLLDLIKPGFSKLWGSFGLSLNIERGMVYGASAEDGQKLFSIRTSGGSQLTNQERTLLADMLLVPQDEFGCIATNGLLVAKKYGRGTIEPLVFGQPRGTGSSLTVLDGDAMTSLLRTIRDGEILARPYAVIIKEPKNQK